MSTSVSVAGRELIAAWTLIDRGIAEWVLKLAEFDASGVWAEDGYHSCASWLAGTCDIGATTAREKLRVAHELTRRHAVRVAFEAGLAYSKVRLLVRLQGVDQERDERFIAHAATDTIRVLEERVNNWNYFATQDNAPANIDDHYGLRRERGFGGGMGRLVMEAPNEMLDRLIAVVDAYGEFLRRNTNGDQFPLNLDGNDPVDDDAMRRTGSDDDTPADAPRSRSARRLDWLLDLLEEVALADPKKIDPYVATVGVTIQYEDVIAGTGLALSAQGSALTGEAVRKLCCDAGIHRIVVRGASEILDFGRAERLFNRELRRAIRFRHGHACAVRGCGRRITHIHHMEFFEFGGETSIKNGIPLCSYHHHLVHDRGWQIEWNPHTGAVRYLGPRGQILESTASFMRAA